MSNRRNTFRVSPDPRRPVRTRLRREGGPAVVEAEVVDLSLTGLSFIARDDVILDEGCACTVSVLLPTCREWFECPGSVRSRVQAESGLRYGIEFGALPRPQADRFMAALKEYWTERQREDARRARLQKRRP